LWSEPIRFVVQPTQDRVHEGHLEVPGRLVTCNPGFTQAKQHGTYILVFEFNGSIGSGWQELQQFSAMLSFAV
jgi:hypothetical protein